MRGIGIVFTRVTIDHEMDSMSVNSEGSRCHRSITCSYKRYSMAVSIILDRLLVKLHINECTDFQTGFVLQLLKMPDTPKRHRIELSAGKKKDNFSVQETKP